MARRIWIVCLSLALAAASLPAGAQEGLLEDLYGRGVHAYFERRYEEAHGLLTKAITSGLKDPRAHYFRGLTYIRLGRPEDAAAEFTTGAELEAIAAEPVNVGKAIERVQGAERLAIEKERRAARVRLFDKAEATAKARYEEREEAEKRVLYPRGRRPAPSAAPASAEESDPFKGGGAKPAPLPAAPTDAKPTTPPPPVPAEDAPAKPAEPKPAEPAADDAKPAAAAEPPRGSVFGALFRAVKNSVPGDNSPAAAPAVNPNAPDPFGTAPATPPGAKPAPKAPASDPFADPPAKPAAAPAANNDPFAK